MEPRGSERVLEEASFKWAGGEYVRLSEFRCDIILLPEFADEFGYTGVTCSITMPRCICCRFCSRE